MARSSASAIYRVTTVVAIVATLAGVGWNVWAFDQRRQAQDDLKALFPDRAATTLSESTVGTLPTAEEVPRVVSEAYQRIGEANEKLQLALTYGGGLILVGIFLYGLGWNARSGSRRR